MSQVEVQKSGLTAGEILVRLQQRVSVNNARLLLNSAKTQTGLKIDDQTVLGDADAKTLCLKLINQGGPAFQVGQAIYKEYLM